MQKCRKFTRKNNSIKTNYYDLRELKKQIEILDKTLKQIETKMMLDKLFNFKNKIVLITGVMDKLVKKLVNYF